MNEHLRPRLDKPRRLRKSAEFQLVRSEGRSWVHPLLVLYTRPNGLQLSRVGISVSKRIGKAVTRNRVKRLIREVARLNVPAVASGWDLLFIARAGVAAAEFATLRSTIEELLRRSGLSGQTTARQSAERAGSEDSGQAS